MNTQKTKDNPEASRIIDALGGTSEVARIFEIEMSAVSQWRKKGIPNYRLMFLRLARPDVFGEDRRKKEPCAGRKPKRRKDDSNE